MSVDGVFRLTESFSPLTHWVGRGALRWWCRTLRESGANRRPSSEQLHPAIHNPDLLTPTRLKVAQLVIEFSSVTGGKTGPCEAAGLRSVTHLNHLARAVGVFGAGRASLLKRVMRKTVVRAIR